MTFQPLWPVTMAVVCFCLAFIAYKDFKTLTIKTRHVQVVAAITLALFFIQATMENTWLQIVFATYGSFVYFALFRIVYLTGQLGGGDVRLAALLGLIHGWYGFDHAAVALFVILAVPAVWGVVVKKQVFPYAPGMCLGSWGVLMLV